MCREALQGLVSRAPEGWSELRYAYRSTVGFSNSALEFTMRDGSKEAGTALVAVGVVGAVGRGLTRTTSLQGVSLPPSAVPPPGPSAARWSAHRP